MTESKRKHIEDQVDGIVEILQNVPDDELKVFFNRFVFHLIQLYLREEVNND